MEGSTTAVTRPLLPFVQDDSPYLRMRKTAAREKLRALQDLALAKHLWIQDDGDAAITMYSSDGLTATDEQGGLSSPIALTPALSPMVLGRGCRLCISVHQTVCDSKGADGMGALFLVVGTIRVVFR